MPEGGLISRTADLSPFHPQHTSPGYFGNTLGSLNCAHKQSFHILPLTAPEPHEVAAPSSVPPVLPARTP